MRLFPLIYWPLLSLLPFLPVAAQNPVYCVDLDKIDFERYDLFNQDIKNKKIIIIGEIHYLEANYIVQTDLLIHLNKHFGVRHLLIEFGRAEAFLYNQYLKTGSERYLNQTFPGFCQFEKFLIGINKLYEYNLGLSSDNKLIVHGLDFEREPGLSASLYFLLSDYSGNPLIENLRNSIKSRLDTIGVERDTKDYNLYLKERILSLTLPDDNNKHVIDYILGNNSFASNLSERDNHMAQTFLALDTTSEAYFGQFGIAHTMLNALGGFAAILNSHIQYQNKVLVTNMYSVNSNNSLPFLDINDCVVTLYRFDPHDNTYEAFSRRGQWALILKDQPSYTPIK